MKKGELRSPTNALRICEIVQIYALVDPRDSRERYIGKANCAETRLRGHIAEAGSGRRQTPVYAWIRKLLSLGLVPQLKIIRTVLAADWQRAERSEIERRRNDLFWSDGFLNIADGGDEPSQTADMRRANAVKMNAALAADPLRARVRLLKVRMAVALREGYVSAGARAKLRAAAKNCPRFFGLYANLPETANCRGGAI